MAKMTASMHATLRGIHRTLRLVAWLAALLGISVSMPCAALGQSQAEPRLLEVELWSGERILGLPIHWSSIEAVMLESGGAMRKLEMTDLRTHRILDVPYRPASLAKVRSELQAELGSAYETLISGPHVIAAPEGQCERWGRRFSSLLAGYARYFEVRGWPLRRPDFPLCVVVFSSRQEFIAYTQARGGGRIHDDIVGIYFPGTNRCILYQLSHSSGIGSDKVNWEDTEATIVHEAVHQLAYNTGIHERLAENPAWFVEGLASMFERPAVYDLSVNQSTLASRIDPDKHERMQVVLRNSQMLEQSLRELIASDSLFTEDPRLAYDLSWGLTFYLAERMPSQLRDYYLLLSQRPFGAYSPGERVRDFHQAFQSDASLLAIQLQRLLLNQR